MESDVLHAFYLFGLTVIFVTALFFSLTLLFTNLPLPWEWWRWRRLRKDVARKRDVRPGDLVNHRHEVIDPMYIAFLGFVNPTFNDELEVLKAPAETLYMVIDVKLLLKEYHQDYRRHPQCIVTLLDSRENRILTLHLPLPLTNRLAVMFRSPL
jgi:hypothetical protein